MKGYFKQMHLVAVSLHLLGNVLIQVCETGTFFQLKVYKRGTFPVKMVYKT